MKLRGIKIKKLKKILKSFGGEFDELLIGIPQRSSLLIFDDAGIHSGSIYLEKEIELQKGK